MVGAEPYIGEITPVGFNFPPRGWATCDGQLVPINQNQALFSLLGTTYGGDGRTTFGLPDLRGRSAVGKGQGPGLSNYQIGQKGGVEQVTLSILEMPSHTHAISADADVVAGSGSVQANGPTEAPSYAPTPLQATKTQRRVSFADDFVDDAGGGQAHENRNPLLGVHFCIALQGLFPSRS